jgi:glutathione S-transferase
MKLYYAPGTCALSPDFVAREAGIEFSLEKVDLKSKKTASGKDYLEINPKGYVPALELGSGTLARYQLQAMLAYINAEIHKTYSMLFSRATVPETQ